MPLSSTRKSLRDLCTRSASYRMFLQEGSLGTILTKSVIHDLLKEDPAVSPKELVQRVDEVHLKASKVLATLILMGRPEKLVGFLKRGLYDNKLPVDEQDLGPELSESRTWVDSFLHEQHIFLAPIFFRGENGPMSAKCILPFYQDEFIDGGALGSVYKVQIAPKHQRLQTPLDGTYKAGWFARRELKITPPYHGKTFEEGKRILRELLKFEHPNILPLLATYSYNDHFNLIFPLADMTLYDYLRSDDWRPYDGQSTMSLFQRVYDLAKALHYIHNFEFIENGKQLKLLSYHHNLQPRNVLVWGGSFVITDFGLANFKEDRMALGVGTAAYNPLGFGAGREHVSQAYDIWSFGCILAEVVTFAVMGAEGVKGFAHRRAARVTHSREDDCFYDGARVKPEVLQYFQELKSLAIDQLEIIPAVIELVEQILDPVADQRPISSEVLGRLEKILSPSLASKLKSLSPLASRLIRLCVFLGDQEIPEEFLYRERAIEWLKKDKYLVPDAIASLLSSSLAKSSINGLSKSLSFDPLLLEEIRMSLNEEEQQWAIRQAVLLIGNIFRLKGIQTTTHWTFAAQILPHINKSLENVRSLNSEYGVDYEVTNAMQRVGSLFMSYGRYTDAEEIFQKSLLYDGLVSSSGEPTFNRLHIMYNLALVFNKLGRRNDALDLCKQVLIGREKILGLEHPETLNAIHSDSSILNSFKKSRESSELSEQVLTLREGILGEEHPDTITSVHDIALVFKSLRRYEQALQLSESILSRQEKLLGKEHPDTLNTMENMADCLENLERSKEALELYTQVVDGKEKIARKEHQETLATGNNLSMTFENRRKYEALLKIYERVSAIQEKTLGREQPDALATIHNRASILEDLSRLEEALEFQRQALAGREKVLGKQHPDTLNTGHSMAFILDSLGRHHEALELYEKVLSGRELVLGERHQHTLITAQSMISVSVNLGMLDEALKRSKQVLTCQTEVLGREHLDTLSTAHSMACVLGKLGRSEEALELYKEVLASQEKFLGKKHPDTLITARNIGSVTDSPRGLKRLRLKNFVLTRYNPRITNYIGSPDFVEIPNGSRSSGKIPQTYEWVMASQEKEPGKANFDILGIDDGLVLAPVTDSSGTTREPPQPGGWVMVSQEELGKEDPDILEVDSGLALIQVVNDNERAQQPNEEVLDSLSDLPNEKHRDESIIASLLEQATSRLNSTIWEIKYMISRLEFNMTWALAPPPINEECPIRVYWKCVSNSFQPQSVHSRYSYVVLNKINRNQPSGASVSSDFLQLNDSLDSVRVLNHNEGNSNNHGLVSSLTFGSTLRWRPRWRSINPGSCLNRLPSLNTQISNNQSILQIGPDSSTRIPDPLSTPQVGPSLSIRTWPSGASTGSQAGSSSCVTIFNPSQIPQIPSNPIIPISAPSHRPQAANNSLPTQQPAQNPSRTDQYILFCFNGGDWIKLVHLDIPTTMRDQAFYEKVRETYYKHRGWWKQWCSLNALLRVNFVKFELIDREFVDICNQPEVPKVGDNHYRFSPNPPTQIPPIRSFMYYFHHHQRARSDNRDLTAIPKKINGRLAHPPTGFAYGWGIHFIEEPSWLRVWMLTIIVVIVTLGFAIIYSQLRNDIQGGYGVAAFLVAVAAFVSVIWGMQVQSIMNSRRS